MTRRTPKAIAKDLAERGVVRGASVTWHSPYQERYGCVLATPIEAIEKGLVLVQASNAQLLLAGAALTACPDVANPIKADIDATYGEVTNG